jgi:hypothetical protein
MSTKKENVKPGCKEIIQVQDRIHQCEREEGHRGLHHWTYSEEVLMSGEKPRQILNVIYSEAGVKALQATRASNEKSCFGDPHIIVEEKCENCPRLIDCIAKGFWIPDNDKPQPTISHVLSDQISDEESCDNCGGNIPADCVHCIGSPDLLEELKAKSYWKPRSSTGVPTTGYRPCEDY